MSKVLEALKLEHTQAAKVEGVKTDEVADVETNANEVMHTGNTGYGKELIPVDVLTQTVVDMIPKYSTFLGTLPGYHGVGLNLSQKVPVIGETGFMQGNTEWTTGTPAGTQAEAKTRLATGEVQLNMAQLILTVYISKRELNYSVADIEALVMDRIARSAARTIESMIVNGDAETGGTGNVNSDDQAPATTFAASGGAYDHRLLLDHGIRELGVNGTGTKVDVGTMDSADFISVMNSLGDLFSNPADCLWLFNRATYNKALGLADFADAAKRGAASTLAGNALTNVFGADLFIARDMGLTEADGKMSATPASNTKGQFALIYKPAIQHGYGQSMDMQVDKVAGKGIAITATLDWGFAIAQKLAGQTDSSVGLGYDVTL